MPQATAVQSQILERVLSTMSDFAVSRADVIPELMRTTSGSNTTSQDLAHVLARDPALTGAVLRVANSAYYGRLRAVASLDEAVTVLGFTLMRSLAVAASLNSVLSGCTEKRLMKTVWDHSLAVAIGSRTIARAIDPGKAEEAFLGGLMHDLAKLILLLHFAEDYAPVLRDAQNDPANVLEIEQARLGVTHVHLGAIILGQWNFPSELCDAVRRHHDPDDPGPTANRIQGTDAGRKLAHIIRLADAMSYMKGYGCGSWDDIVLTDHPTAQHLGLSYEEVLNLADQASELFLEEQTIYAAS